MLDFAEHDDPIPVSDVQTIQAAYPAVPVYVYPAMALTATSARARTPLSAKQAWERTLSFLTEHLSGQLGNLPT